MDLGQLPVGDAARAVGARSAAFCTWLPVPSRSAQLSYRLLELFTSTKTRVMAVAWANSSISARAAWRSAFGPFIRVHRANGRTMAITANAMVVYRNGVPVRLMSS